MKAVPAKAYLVNTGWNGMDHLIFIKNTRALIDISLHEKIDHAPTFNLPIFNLSVPAGIAGLK